jgi:hypothetical protein
MSDGPHRSLSMKRGWRRVAERADNSAFGVDEISNAVIPALRRDCRDEMSSEFIEHIRRLIEEQEMLLIKDDFKERIETLRNEAGCGIGQQLIENVVRISAGRDPEMLDLIHAMGAALADRAVKCGRQLEEHYLRKSTAARTNNVRARLEKGIAGAPLDSLAREALNIKPRSPVRPDLKRDGLDDGVGLP